MTDPIEFHRLSEQVRREVRVTGTTRWWHYPVVALLAVAVSSLLAVCHVIDWIAETWRRWTAPPVVRYCGRCDNTGWERVSVRGPGQVMGREVCDHNHNEGRV